ncbi:hypothetical protein CCB80_06215 [Armatimonadetes bacterium Uphvl-Ar1]|nr:hypothetical protein CCB80_06215 [Armatimonadetes bacterium Uphvl-Ar1]
MIKLRSILPACLLFPLTCFGWASTAPQEITFTGSGIELSGTLTVPSNAKKSPAVLLMPGSGPTDRNGNQPGLQTNLLFDLSDTLVKNGYATLRFDKRPVARYQSVWPKTNPEISKFFSFENHLADAKAAYEFLKSRPEIDPEKIYILGHSEGGLIANQIAPDLKPAGLILLGSPGRSMAEILREQLMRSISAIQDESLKSRLTSDLDRALIQLTKEPVTLTDLHPGLQSLFSPSNADILHGYFTSDPIANAKQYSGRVFIANGEMDIQISAISDAKPLHEAYGAKSHLEIIPNASHNFKTVTQPTDPGFTGPVHPKLVTSLLDWLKVK